MDQPSLAMLLLLALLPAVGSVIGVLLAEWRQPPDWLVGAALHAAAGIATAVVAVELLPRALERAETWLLAVAVMGGAIVSILIYRGIGWARRRFGGGEGDGAKRRLALWTVYAAVATDLFTDGLTTGAGAAVSGGLGLLLALSQVFANIPGGFAVTANFRSAGVPRAKRLMAAAFYPATPVVGAAAGFFALRGAGPEMTGAALAFFGGLLLIATVEDLLPQADQPGAPRRISSPAFAGGFVMLMLISAYLGV